MRTKFTILMSLMALAGACGSDDPITAIDRATDCADICSRYKDCISTDYDTKACNNRCQDMVSSKDTSRIDTCEDCLDEKSCTQSTFSCASECVGLVP